MKRETRVCKEVRKSLMKRQCFRKIGWQHYSELIKKGVRDEMREASREAVQVEES